MRNLIAAEGLLPNPQPCF